MSIFYEAMRAKVTVYMTSLFTLIDPNFWGDTRIFSMVDLGSLKLRCLKETKLAPFIHLLCLTESLYIVGRDYT